MRKPVLVIVLVTLVIAGAAVFVVLKFTGGSPESAAANAGECVVVTNHNDDRADVSGAGCDSEKATFKVGMVLADTKVNCSEDDDYTQIVPNSGGGKLCLLPNFVEGACYQPHDDDDDSWGKSPCTGEDTIKVTKVISGSAAPSGCPETEESQDMSYSQPPVTFCVSPVKS